MTKKYRVNFIMATTLLLVAFSLSACGKKPDAEANTAVNGNNQAEQSKSNLEDVSKQDEPEAPKLVETDNVGYEDSIDEYPECEDKRKAYIDILERMIYKYVMPDGHIGDKGGANIKFAVYDIDNDGSDELLIQYDARCIAAQATYIMDFDESSKKVALQYLGFIDIKYFDN